MGVVRLDDDGATRRQRRRGVAAGDREGERKVACAEDGDGAERYGALADVGTRQRGAIGQGGIDAGAVPASLAQHFCEQSELTGGAAHLAGEARRRQAGLGGRPGDQRVAQRFDVLGDPLEEGGAALGGGGAVLAEGRGRGRAGLFDVAVVAVPVHGFEFGACVGVEGADLGAAACDEFAGDDHPSQQSARVGFGLGRVLSRVCHTFNARSRIDSCPRPI